MQDSRLDFKRPEREARRNACVVDENLRANLTSLISIHPYPIAFQMYGIIYFSIFAQNLIIQAMSKTHYVFIPALHESYSSLSVGSLLALKVPLKHLLENALTPRLNDIPVTRNNPIKIPTSNFLSTLTEPAPIPRTSNIPQEPLLPSSRTHSILHPNKHPRQKPTRRSFTSSRKLLIRRQVKHHISLNKRLIRLMAKHQLLIRMTAHILVVELSIKFRVDLHIGFVLLRPDMLEMVAGCSWVFFPFLWQTLDTH